MVLAACANLPLIACPLPLRAVGLQVRQAADAIVPSGAVAGKCDRVRSCNHTFSPRAAAPSSVLP